jgi:hypothetical protein
VQSNEFKDFFEHSSKIIEKVLENGNRFDSTLFLEEALEGNIEKEYNTQ